MLTLKNIQKKFQHNQVLKGIDLEVSDGSVVVLLGSSGSGKTTLLRCINQLEKADEGQLSLDGQEINLHNIKKQEVQYLRKSTAMVFQHYYLFRNKTVLENITEALCIVQSKSKSEANNIAEPLLESVGIWNKRDEYPSRLSGGQQQRVGIARAIALHPKLLLLDEPTSALDPELVGDILELITRIAKMGYTMLIVTHEIDFANHIADKIVFMDQGVILEEGSPREVILNPKFERTKQFLSRYNNTIEYSI